MSRVSRPGRSTAQNRRRASASGTPSATMAEVSWSAMPAPAVPIPKITIRWPVSGTPVALAAASTAARLTAPVPWMSSLNVSRLFRYRSSSRLAFATPRSSQCSRACGNNLPTAVTNWSRKESYSAAGTRGWRLPIYSGSSSRLWRSVPTSSMTGMARPGSIPPAAV